MKKLKILILFIILAITVGIAAVSSNLLINGSTPIAINPDDFLVYFSDVLVDGTQDLSLVQSETSLSFNAEFSAVGDKKEIIYDITNASKNYDADIDITCTQSTEYLSIINDFDSSSNLAATSTRTGVLTVVLSKSYIGSDLKQDISCTISASAVERSSQGSGSVAGAVDPLYIGREISIGEEKFNVISIDDDSVTMLARYNISNSTPYEQTDDEKWATFSDNEGWEYGVESKDVDVQLWGDMSKTRLNNYVSYLNSEYRVLVTGDLITISELGKLGCTIPTDYTMGTCDSSEYSDWLINGQDWWTFSIIYDTNRWGVSGSGELIDVDIYDLALGVRPVITILKEVLNTQIISFTISGDIYFAENDMTWGEWVVSKYNVTNNIKSLDGYIFIDEFILGDSDSFFVLVGDSVLANHSYMSLGVGYS